jgi:hypothetical protein
VRCPACGAVKTLPGTAATVGGGSGWWIGATALAALVVVAVLALRLLPSRQPVAHAGGRPAEGVEVPTGAAGQSGSAADGPKRPEETTGAGAGGPLGQDGKAPAAPASRPRSGAGEPEPPEPAQGPGERFALLVGVNAYQHEKLRPLRYAVRDAAELGQVLQGAGYRVTVLTDAKGTRANIEHHLEILLRRCRKGDTVVVALAGHGVQFEGKPDAYFCPHDARPFPDAADSLVSLGRIYEAMDRSFTGMKVLLVDACRDDPGATRDARGITADGAPRPPQGVAALFSCRAGEQAYESDQLEHGVFFYHVLEGLRGRAKDADGEVTFAGLAAYVQKQVPRTVGGLVGGGARQSPNLKADYATEPVLVSRNDPGPQPGAVPPTPPAPPGGSGLKAGIYEGKGRIANTRKTGSVKLWIRKIGKPPQKSAVTLTWSTPLDYEGDLSGTISEQGELKLQGTLAYRAAMIELEKFQCTLKGKFENGEIEGVFELKNDDAALAQLMAAAGQEQAVERVEYSARVADKDGNE